MKLLSIFCLCIFASLQATAQDRFEVTESWVEMPEGGKIHNYTIVSGNYCFSLIPPPDFEISPDKISRKVWLKIPDKVGISMQVTANYSGGLPDGETLKRTVLQKYTGGAVLRSTGCRTGAGLGWIVDVKRVLDKNSSLITRHAFVPWPSGSVEFVFSTNSEDFEKYRNAFANLLSSFQIERYQPRKEP
jgi:hypothetical protein